MKTPFSLFLVVVLAFTFAIPAQAQSREYQRAYQNTLGVLQQPMNNWMSSQYGYNPYGGYNRVPRAGYPGSYEPFIDGQGQYNPGFGYGTRRRQNAQLWTTIGSSLATIGMVAWDGHKTREAIKKANRRVSEQGSGEVWVNCTGSNMEINGEIVPHNGMIEVEDPDNATYRAACEVKSRSRRDGSFDLTCK